MRRILLAAFFSITLLSISNRSEAQILINYWSFNNFTAVDTFGSAFNPIPLIDADYSAINTKNAYMRYAFDSGTSVKSEDSCWIDETTGSTVNAQQSAAAGNCLRVRNPSDFTQLLFYIPTTGYKNINVSYALQSSSAKSGQAVESFAYSVDSGVTWKTASLTVDGANVDTLLDTAAVYINGFGLVTIGFGSDTTVNNNSKLVLRMQFKSYTTGAIAGTSGNARLDNIAVTGNYLAASIIVLTPPAGDTLLVGQSQLITYETFGLVTDFRAVDFSSDSGKTWVEVGISTTDSFTWVVPNDTSSNCFIEVLDENGVKGKSGKFVLLVTKPIPPPPPPPPPTPPWLIDYWNFTAITKADTVPNTPRIKATYSKLDTNAATITDTLQPGTSSHYVGWFDDVAGDTTNHQLGDLTKIALRARNPTDSMEVLMFLPSTGYKDLSVEYGLESSSTTSGQLVEFFDYSTDGGNTWKNSSLTVQGLPVDTLDVTNPIFQGTSWGLVTVTFGDDTTVNNNPNLVLRIRFRGNNTGTSGNNRFEHVTFEGTSTTAPPAPPVPDSIVVTAPVAGDTLLSGTQQIISYTVTSSTSHTRRIEYSTNGGISGETIGTDTALTYNWTVPATQTSDAVVLVVDSTGVTGRSGKFVVVVPGTLDSVWVSPSPVISGKTANIHWTAMGYLGNSMTINVFYDGVTPNLVENGPAEATGSYSWSVPAGVVLSGVFVQVSFASGTTRNSDPFNIDAPTPPAAVSDGSIGTSSFALWPNPLQTQATCQYELTSPENVTLSIHDLVGREVESIQVGAQGAGMHQIMIDGSQLPNGVYMYELVAGSTRYRGQLVIVR
jgi:hypothetical protein